MCYWTNSSKKVCENGELARLVQNETVIIFSAQSNLAGLRLTTKAIHQSTRDDNKEARCTGLIFQPTLVASEKAYVPLRNVSVEAWIDSFAADVTLTQVFVNEEKTNIEAVYVFPIEVCYSHDEMETNDQNSFDS